MPVLPKDNYKQRLVIKNRVGWEIPNIGDPKPFKLIELFMTLLYSPSHGVCFETLEVEHEPHACPLKFTAHLPTFFVRYGNSLFPYCFSEEGEEP